MDNIKGEDKMSSKNHWTLKLIVDELDCFIELKLNPKDYFHPYLIYGPNDLFDEENGISEEQFEKERNESVKINKMFQDKRYKELFETKFLYNLQKFLRRIEYEVEIEYEELMDTHPKEEFKKEVPFKTTFIPRLDSYFIKNEDAIFEYIQRKGPYILGNTAILSKIQRWCYERNNKKLKRLGETLKEFAKIKRGPTPLPLDMASHIIFEDVLLRKQIKELREKIKSYEKEIRKEEMLSERIISECKDFEWFQYLKEYVKEEFGEGDINFVRFIRDTAPRDISIGILAKMFKVNSRIVEEVFRERKKIMEHSKL